MRMEFHQLERRLLASLGASGQQTPIVVVASEQAEHYLVIDGYQRIRALEQLGRDTVEVVIWSTSETEALLLDRSMRWGERETALEEGWQLVELEQRFPPHGRRPFRGDPGFGYGRRSWRAVSTGARVGCAA